jgi:hypothetical protein
VAIRGRPDLCKLSRNPLDLNACYQREMKDVLKRAGIFLAWLAWIPQGLGIESESP